MFYVSLKIEFDIWRNNKLLRKWLHHELANVLAFSALIFQDIVEVRSDSKIA